MHELPDLSDASFEQKVLRKPQPSLIVFWADWNEASAHVLARLEAIAEGLDGAFQLARINVDDHPMVSSQYELDSLPAVVLIHQGKVIETHAGDLPRALLDELVASTQQFQNELGGQDSMT